MIILWGSGYFRAGMGLDDSKQWVQNAQGVVTLLTPQVSYGKYVSTESSSENPMNFFPMLHWHFMFFNGMFYAESYYKTRH